MARFVALIGLALACGLLLGACGSGPAPKILTATVTVPASVSAPSTALTPTATTSTRAPSGSTRPTSTIPPSLAAGLRPIGAGRRFHPRVLGRPTGRCSRRPGRLEAHVELFAANRVVLIAGGVGHRGRCYGSVVTLDPTGIVHFRPHATLKQLFRAWGEPLSARRMASFRGRVRAYVDGRRVRRLPRLGEHAEIVLEVGPYVPPHVRFRFPHLAARRARHAVRRNAHRSRRGAHKVRRHPK